MRPLVSKITTQLTKREFSTRPSLFVHFIPDSPFYAFIQSGRTAIGKTIQTVTAPIWGQFKQPAQFIANVHNTTIPHIEEVASSLNLQTKLMGKERKAPPKLPEAEKLKSLDWIGRVAETIDSDYEISPIASNILLSLLAGLVTSVVTETHKGGDEIKSLTIDEKDLTAEIPVRFYDDLGAADLEIAPSMQRLISEIKKSPTQYPHTTKVLHEIEKEINDFKKQLSSTKSIMQATGLPGKLVKLISVIAYEGSKEMFLAAKESYEKFYDEIEKKSPEDAKVLDAFVKSALFIISCTAITNIAKLALMTPRTVLALRQSHLFQTSFKILNDFNLFNSIKSLLKTIKLTLKITSFDILIKTAYGIDPPESAKGESFSRTKASLNKTSSLETFKKALINICNEGKANKSPLLSHLLEHIKDKEYKSIKELQEDVNNIFSNAKEIDPQTALYMSAISLIFTQTATEIVTKESSLLASDISASVILDLNDEAKKAVDSVLDTPYSAEELAAWRDMSDMMVNLSSLVVDDFDEERSLSFEKADPTIEVDDISPALADAIGQAREAAPATPKADHLTPASLFETPLAEDRILSAHDDMADSLLAATHKAKARAASPTGVTDILPETEARKDEPKGAAPSKPKIQGLGHIIDELRGAGVGIAVSTSIGEETNNPEVLPAQPKKGHEGPSIP